MNDCFVLRNDGRYDFSHKSIREGLLRRCENPTALHRKLLDHFISLDPEDDIRRQEIMHHCICADDKAYFIEYIQDKMWEDNIAIEYAAKVTYAATLLDQGKWLQAVLDQGQQLGANRYLAQFIYKFFDRLISTRASELDMLFHVYLSNYNMIHAIAKVSQTRQDWTAVGYSLEIISDIKEAMGTEKDIRAAQGCRKDQLMVAEVLHKTFQDKHSDRYLARAHELLAANMRLSEDENVTETREHLTKALQLREHLGETPGEEKDRADLGKLYLKLAKVYSGWLHSNFELALEYTKKAKDLYQNLYDTTQKVQYLTQLADIYGTLARVDDFDNWFDDHPEEADDNHPKNVYYQKQLETLEIALQKEHSILHRQLLAAAHLNYIQEWILVKKDTIVYHIQKAVSLYRSIARERGTVEDMRNLSQALYAAVEKLPEGNPVPLLEEAIAIRQPLYDKLAAPADQDFLARLYHTLSLCLEDPARQEACRVKAKELGYVDMRKNYTEVLEVLRHMDAFYIDRIPKEVIMFIYDRCDLNYDFRMTKSIAEENLHPYTLLLLRTLLDGFWKNENFTRGDVYMNRIFGKLN